MSSSDDEAWFEPKRFGYGAGLPITWQGWALTLGFAAAAILLGILVGARRPILFIAVLIPLTLGFLLIAARHTRGGWKWRWRGED